MKFPNRKLNEIEKVFFKLDLSSPFNVLINIQITGHIKREVLEEALSRLKRNRYLLNYFIREGENPEFIYTDKPILFDEIGYNNNQERIELIQKELNTRSVYDAHPLAKLTVLKNENNIDLIFKISHIISDGICAYNAAKELLYCVNDIENGVPSTSNEFKELYPDLKFFPQWNLDKLKQLDRVKELEYIENCVDINNRSTHIIEKDLSLEDSCKVFSFCKQNEISVNSFLMACLVKPMAERLRAKGYTSGILKTSSGINLRKYYNCDVDDQVLGFWSGFGYLFYNLGHDIDVVDFSKRYQVDLKSYLANNSSFFYLKTLVDNYLNKSVQEISSDYKKKIPYVLLTNIGKLNITLNCRDRFTIKKINLMTPMHRNWINDLGFGICASTTNDKLNLILNYMSPAWKQENAQKFADSILYLIMNPS
ncbi:MAG: hypothetical protein HC815_27365 [Richelia sp. RM1_1_1]|nr:hypothetical protein [Richelia sp. RM1_1_1]